MVEDILMELGIEACPMCIVTLKGLLKDGVNGHILLPCIRSANACKNYYQCAHQTKKCRTNIQCIRYNRDNSDGYTTMKLSNTGRRRFLAEF